MGIIASVVSWCLSIAEDDSHGYDQTNRWGPDYDCSSLLIEGWERAGVPVKTNGASYTGDMVSVFKECGFKDVTGSINLTTGDGLIKGDVVWKSGHVEMCSKPGYLVGAHINEFGEVTGGLTGDQTGKEIYERTYYNSPWTIVLRYPEKDVDIVDKSEVTSSNEYLSESEMQINARYIYQYFTSKGWTINAISGMLGNMQQESTINPGLWQGRNEGNLSGGFGLTQWTPATNHINWCESHGYSDYTDIDSQLNHIMYELENGEQYYSTDSYPETFREFTQSTKSPEYLASAFMENYERPGTPEEENRKTYARYWFDYLSGFDPSGPDEPTYKPVKKHSFNFLLTANRRRTSWTKRKY